MLLPDGRLLALLGNWSGDRAGHPGRLYHGLWTSAGDDWTRYTEYRPSFSPRPPRPAKDPPGMAGYSPFVTLGATRGPRGVMWVQSWDNRVWVSGDGREFREIPVR